MKELAIVIPAYKESYFDKALQSLAAQTNKNFTVYIGDDCSPHKLETIVDRYRSVMDIHYKKFNKNVGSKNIVYQWKRCIELSRNENWIWLFSDDDIVDKNAVENFFSISSKNKQRFDVYRFNTHVIDENDKLLSISPIGPMEESSHEMAYNLLIGLRGNSMPDHIFSRDIYNKCGGFVVTEFAQAADWATSILFSKEKGICIIPNSLLYWRFSGINISSIAKDKSRQMLIGHLQFIQWVLQHFSYLDDTSVISFPRMKEAALINLKNVIVNHYKVLDNVNIPKVFWILNKNIGLSTKESLQMIYDIKRCTDSKINTVIDFIKSFRKTKQK